MRIGSNLAIEIAVYGIALPGRRGTQDSDRAPAADGVGIPTRHSRARRGRIGGGKPDDFPPRPLARTPGATGSCRNVDFQPPGGGQTKQGPMPAGWFQRPPCLFFCRQAQSGRVGSPGKAACPPHSTAISQHRNCAEFLQDKAYRTNPTGQIGGRRRPNRERARIRSVAFHPAPGLSHCPRRRRRPPAPRR